MNVKHNGLSSAEAQRILDADGENALISKKKNSVAAMFFSQFKDLMILILAVSTVISVAMGEGTEAITIIVIVLLNAIMGFIQEYRTEKTLNALKELSAPCAVVIRDGEKQQIASKHVVKGDCVILSAGDRVPADCKITDSMSLTADEALLTGESTPIPKPDGSTALMGSVITEGRGEGVVIRTGMQTEMGKIADMLNDAEEEKTPLQQRLAQLGKFVAIACLVICLSVAFIGFLRGEKFLDMLLCGVSLAVAAIPEGMPAIVTIVLALSVGRILKKGTIIRKLHAVETLGCAGVICTDKTGTVTENRMTVKSIYSADRLISVNGAGDSPHGSFTCNDKYIRADADRSLSAFFRCALLCSSSEIHLENSIFKTNGNPTEIALLIAAAKGGTVKSDFENGYRLIKETPFDSRRKIMSTLYSYKGKKLLCVKGAPDILLSKCTSYAASSAVLPLSAAKKEEILFVCRQMAKGALRTIALAESCSDSPNENSLTFLGLAGIIDPPRPEVSAAVKRCRRAGIKPVMITGDHIDTARAIAKQVGIYRNGDTVFCGDELDKLSDGALAAQCMNASVFARVNPSHKLRIVKAYKACGQVVAMTGDGVNDAPAIKQADIGVAMNSGTDVTKEAAGVIICDNNFATIVSAVEEGRIIYQNIRRFIRYLLTGNLGEVLSMLFSILMGLPMALVPIQILMMNLLTDGLPAIALGMEPPAYDIMNSKPRKKDESLFAGGLMRIILLRGILLGLATSLAYYAVFSMCGDLIVSRSAAFLTMVLSQMVHIFECRGSGFKLGGNIFLLVTVAFSAFLAVASVYVPFVRPIFNTAPVTGINLIPVIIGIFISPVITFILRRIKRLFTK